MRIFPSFTAAHSILQEELKQHAYLVHPGKWQSLDVSAKPEMAMRELFNVSFQVPTRGTEEVEYWQKDILPNLPFADRHFEERVGRKGTNPGEAWKIWPWGNSADAHRTENGRFTHTYQERFWPNDLEDRHAKPTGIRYPYADYGNLLQNLMADPLTRQAYLPIWYPEDGACLGRKPCTLGYHFLLRHDFLHITYYIRSCDFVRHWRDDCYFALRLLLFTLWQLRKVDVRWDGVKPGLFIMHIASLHMFINDWYKIGGKER
jgi:hypothetical protein